MNLLKNVSLIFLLSNFGFAFYLYGMKPPSTCVDKYEELYSIIDAYLQDSLHAGVTAVSCNLNSFLDTISNKSNRYPPPPPPPPTPRRKIQYSKAEFEYYYKLGYIDSIDINYMYDQVATRRKYMLDSTKINTVSLTPGNYSQKKYDGFIILSTPLISKDGQTIITTIDYINPLQWNCMQTRYKSIWWKKGKRWVEVHREYRWLYH